MKYSAIIFAALLLAVTSATTSSTTCSSNSDCPSSYCCGSYTISGSGTSADGTYKNYCVPSASSGQSATVSGITTSYSCNGTELFQYTLAGIVLALLAVFYY